jgi:uncharacterized protein YaiE (UPF0345 family)
MTDRSPDSFSNATVPVLANVYFDGKVVSHTLMFTDGSKKSLGVIFPGTYELDTAAPEVMQITAGKCRALIPGQAWWQDYEAGQEFSVPADSAFEIAVDEGICQYVCSYG